MENKKVKNRNVHVAKNDNEWRRLVLEKYTTCAWPGCSNYASDAHHIVRRDSLELRQVVENGIGLCRKHHLAVESLPRKTYWKVISFIISEEITKFLQELNPFEV